ncbi:hypothetical protein [Xanthobacter wiegelii]|uniref:hypothetical protein n=1 Tax=Xanthobacter wiegelii TaxID=3119913 RepID=UPI00372BB6FE
MFTHFKVLGALGACALLAGCATFRPLNPPETNVRAGYLYSADLSFSGSSPVHLRLMCNVPGSIANSINYQEESTVANLGVTREISLSGTISGIQASVVSASLAGSLSDYYDLKMTNTVKKFLSEEEARIVFNKLMNRPTCYNEYVANRGRSVYQIFAIYVGDVELKVRGDRGFSADLSAKLKALEPKAKVEIKRKFDMSFSGKQMVGAVETIKR